VKSVASIVSGILAGLVALTLTGSYVWAGLVILFVGCTVAVATRSLGNPADREP
jgi:hypothetical protein